MIYNSIANNGKMMNPYLVKEILQDGKSINKIEPKVIKEKICSQETVKSLQSMLAGVVSRGTADEITKQCKFAAAGKTGTSKINENGKYIEKYNASFVGYFPTENPQYTIIVVINRPNKKEYYAAKVAVPVFIEIANKIYSSHIQIQPTLVTSRITEAPYVLNGNQQSLKSILNDLNISSQSTQPTAAFVEAQSKGYSVNLKPLNIQANVAPNFKGMGLRDALQVAKMIPVKITFEGYGRVVSQSINAGTNVSPSNKIHLKLSPAK
jgi:cell division protein FtsI (penicillin-binding protein 3)